jgi:hypothetical protein
MDIIFILIIFLDTTITQIMPIVNLKAYNDDNKLLNIWSVL